jgi:hypothetical protein
LKRKTKENRTKPDYPQMTQIFADVFNLRSSAKSADCLSPFPPVQPAGAIEKLELPLSPGNVSA